MTTNNSSDYWPQLDGLRAAAVFGVLIEHFLPPDHPLRKLGFSWGEAGVQCFFVLSGFLITAILLRCRGIAESAESSRVWQLRQFYIRRFLRIFPLFYATIVVCWALNLGSMRETWLWHVTYLSNLGIVLADGKGFGHSFHFWSLAVEEQFYLVWPLLMLFLPQRLLLPAILSALLAAPLFRLSAALAPVPWTARFLLTPACLDTLAGGALLAWCWHNSEIKPYSRAVIRSAALIGCLFQASLLCGLWSPAIASAMSTVFGRCAWAGIFVYVVNAAATGIPGWPGRLLTSGPVVSLGRISYGVYVLHHFMIDALNSLGAKWPTLLQLSDGPRFLILTAMTLTAATASWFLLEAPLNSWKDRFPYRRFKPREPNRPA